MTVTRGTALAGFPELVSELGGDATSMLIDHGIDPAAVGFWDRFITYQRVAAVLGDAAQQLGCLDFGMRLATRQGVEILGPIAVVIRHSETFSEAMTSVGRYLHTIAPADVIELRREPWAAVFTFAQRVRQLQHRDHLVEKSLVTAMSAFRIMLGDEIIPLRVTMQHRQISSDATYRAIFGCDVEFGSELNSIHLPPDVLHRPIGGHDTAALRLAEDYLSRAGARQSLADQVGEVIRRLLGLEQASLVFVARALDLHPRVLQRRLAEHRITFEEILDDVRKALAWELAGTEMQATQISRLLGYSEQSSYTRACRRWYGESPRQLAVRRRSAAPAGWR